MTLWLGCCLQCFQNESDVSLKVEVGQQYYDQRRREVRWSQAEDSAGRRLAALEFYLSIAPMAFVD
jgi:hypothetical protein